MNDFQLYVVSLHKIGCARPNECSILISHTIMKHHPTNSSIRTSEASPLATNQQEPNVTVGIVSGERIASSLNHPYEVEDQQATGDQWVELANGAILWNGNRYSELVFRPTDEGASFSLKDVTIGVNFHWERKETQTFLGILRSGHQRVACRAIPGKRHIERDERHVESATAQGARRDIAVVAIGADGAA